MSDPAAGRPPGRRESGSPRPAILSGIVDIAGGAGVVATFLAAMWHWNELPGRIPTHFSLDGTPDSYGGRWTIWALPFISLVLFVALSGMATRVGGAVGLGRSGAGQGSARLLGEEIVGAMRTAVVWLMALLTWQTVQVALGRRAGLDLREGLPLVVLLALVAGWIVLSGARRRKAI